MKGNKSVSNTEWNKIDLMIRNKSKAIPVQKIIDMSNQGDKNAMLRMARMYRDGVGFNQDMNVSIKLMSECSTELISARLELADMLIKRGDKADYIRARELLESYDDGQSKMRLGRIYFGGLGIKQDLDWAIELFEDASKDVEWAKIELANALIKRKKEHDISHAIEVLEKMDLPVAMIRLARIYHDVVIPRNSYLSIIYSYKGSICGNIDYKRIFATYLIKSKSIIYVKAGLQILMDLSHVGDSKSTFLISDYYWSELKDVENSITWARKTCEQHKSSSNIMHLHSCLFHRGNDEDYLEISNDAEVYHDIKIIPSFVIQSCMYCENFDKAESLLKDRKDVYHRFLISDVYKYGKLKNGLNNIPPLKAKYYDYQCYNLPVKEFRREANIMYISSDEYVKYTIVSIHSILKNNKDRVFNFYILSYGICDDNRRLLKSLENKDVHIKIILVDESLFCEFNFPVKGLWTTMGLMRLIPHVLLPSSLNHLLSLGADVIVDSNIDEIFDLNLGENYIAATTTGYECNEFLSGEGNGVKSINGDFVIYNLKKMRENNINFQDYLAKLNVIDATEEQYLARLFNGKMMIIDFAVYNYRVGIRDIVKRHFQDGAIFPKPKIIQFAAFPKPWTLFYENEKIPRPLQSTISQEHLKIFKIWWKYARECPHFNKLYNEMLITRSGILTSVNGSNLALLKRHSNNSTTSHELGKTLLCGENGFGKNIQKATQYIKNAAESDKLWIIDYVYALSKESRATDPIKNVISKLSDDDLQLIKHIFIYLNICDDVVKIINEHN